MKRKAFFAGSFDPFTIGHHSIVERALKIFDSVVIGVGYNERKQTACAAESRVAAISRIYADDSRVETVCYSGLTVKAAAECGATALLRGARTVADFESERTLADVNRRIGGMETVILFTLPEYECVSSSMVRELINNGVDPTPFLPQGYIIPSQGAETKS